MRDVRRKSAWTYLFAAILFAAGFILAFSIAVLVAPVPPWLPATFAVASVVLAILWLRTGKVRAARVLYLISALLMLAVALVGSVWNPYWQSQWMRPDRASLPFDEVLSRMEALADLDFAWSNLRRAHPAFLRSAPAETAKRYREVRAALGSADGITVSDEARAIQYVLSPLRDAHTRIRPNFPEPRYMKETDARAQAGEKCIAVNGIAVEEMPELYKDLISSETESYALVQIRQHLATLEGLAYLGFSGSQPVTYTYLKADGTTEEVEMTPDDFVLWEDYSKRTGVQEEDSMPFVRYEIDVENSLGVLTLDACVNNEEYRDTLRRFFSEVAEGGVRNVAVDLRENGGGNSTVADEFLKYLDTDAYGQWAYDQRFGPFVYETEQTLIPNPHPEGAALFGGDVYVLTSPRTFSSAMMFAEYLADNGLAKLVGEAPGNAPNSYGDIVPLRLPNSGLKMTVSTKTFHRLDGREGLLEPDIPSDADEALETLRSFLEETS